MTCGLPTFATSKGGPAEIIIDGVSGFHIDPLNGDESSGKIANFFQKCKIDPNFWNMVSNGGLQRLYETYKCMFIRCNDLLTLELVLYHFQGIFGN